MLARGDKPDAAIQLVHLRTAAEAIAPLTAQHDVVICHGNGPQVGMLSLESETDHALTRPYPLDDLVAQTQGMIGYWLAQALHNAGVKKPVLGLITQTLVDSADPAFTTRTKFVGPGYARDRAQLLAHRHGWTIAADNGQWRRVVASPEPLRVVEQDSITRLNCRPAPSPRTVPRRRRQISPGVRRSFVSLIVSTGLRETGRTYS